MNYAQIISETEAELKETEDRQKLVQLQKRVRFLRALKSGEAHTQAQAGAVVGWELRQSQKIWQYYRAGGMEAVLRKPKRWGFGKLSSRQLAHLQNHLREFGAADLAAVQRICQAQFNVTYTIGGVSALCARLRIKLKTARAVNIKQDANKVETYKKTLAS